MDPGRRTEYRVNVDESDALGVKIRLSGGREVEGKLFDLSGYGAGILFEQPDPPALTIGEEADLIFESAKLDSPISDAARIQHRNEEDAHRRYGFRFLEPQHLESLLPSEFGQYFNRRRVERVATAPYEPIPATMHETDGEPVDVQLVNVSEGGAAVSMEALFESRFSQTTQIMLRFKLPGTRHAIDFAAHIRYRRLVASHVQYGLEFDVEATPGFAKKRRAIARYIHRQDQNLRKSA